MRPLTESTAWLLGRRDVPYSVRGTFRREVWHMMFWGVVWGALNGNFMSYVAAKSLHASDLLVGVISAAVAVANIMAVWWGALITRWSMRRVVMATLIAIAAVMFSFSLTPLAPITPLQGAAGAWIGTIGAAIFTVQLMVSWILMQTLNTARTYVWRSNFPASHRARIVARFAIWQVLVGSVWAGTIGFYLDGHLPLERIGLREVSLHWLPLAGEPFAYALLIPISGLAALAAAWIYSRQRIRGERKRAAEARTIDRERDDTDDLPHGLEISYSEPGWFSTILGGMRTGMGNAFGVLRTDRKFAAYMSWQFLAGSATLMVSVPFVLILKEEFRVNYGAAASLLTVVPQIALIVSTPFWAHTFDRWRLMQFRSVHMLMWTVSRLALGVGIWQHSLVIVAISMALQGVSLGAGRLSWQIGHMRFSNRENDAAYMSLHQTLTGIRGLVMPFLGLALYRTLLGVHVIWLSAALQFVSVIGFWRLGRSDTR